MDTTTEVSTAGSIGGDTASRLAPLTALDTDGTIVHFRDLWRARPVILVFVRHFG